MRIMLMKLPPFSLSFCTPVRSLGPATRHGMPQTDGRTDGPYRKLEMPAQRRGEEERHCVSGVPLNGRCKSGAHKCTGAEERAGQVSQVERGEGRRPTSPLMNRLSKGEERERLDSLSGWLAGQLTRE